MKGATTMEVVAPFYFGRNNFCQRHHYTDEDGAKMVAGLVYT